MPTQDGKMQQKLGKNISSISGGNIKVMASDFAQFWNKNFRHGRVTLDTYFLTLSFLFLYVG